MRFLLLVVGGLVGVGTLLATLGARSDSDVSAALVQMLGYVALFVGAVGFLTGMYVANEQGTRVKYTHHIGDIRGYFKEVAPDLVDHLTLPPSLDASGKPSGPRGPTFLAWPMQGRFASFSVVAFLTAFAVLAGTYLLTNSTSVACALNSSESDKGLSVGNPAAVIMAFLSVLGVQYFLFYWIAGIWRGKYLSGERRFQWGFLRFKYRKQRSDEGEPK